MAANDPGLAPMAAPAVDPAKGMIEAGKDGMVEEERPIAPDQFDEKYETSKWEIWAYYSYYIGNNGMLYTIYSAYSFRLKLWTNCIPVS